MTVSLLCANFNNGKFLDKFFSSILESTLIPECIIFVDDASTDNSLDILSKYINLLNIYLIPLKKNVGFANALNIGLPYCRTEFIARIDPDDFLHPFRLESQVKIMRKNASLGAIGSQAQYFHSSGNSIANLNLTNMPIGYSAIKSAYYRGDNGLLHGTILIRADIFMRYKYRQDQVPSEDYGIFSRMLADGVVFENIDSPLTFVRIHIGSVSNDLKFDAIEKLMKIRTETLGVPCGRFRIYAEYISLKNYRKYLSERNSVKKLFFISVACIFGPGRLFRRVFSL